MKTPVWLGHWDYRDREGGVPSLPIIRVTADIPVAKDRLARKKHNRFM